MEKNRIKNNLVSYTSVIDLAVTGFKCYIIHFFKTGKLPQKRTKCSRADIQEELRKIAEELKDKEAPVECPGPME